MQSAKIVICQVLLQDSLISNKTIKLIRIDNQTHTHWGRNLLVEIRR